MAIGMWGGRDRTASLDESVFDTITEHSAYWIGFLLADGNVYCGKGQPIIQISLGKKDKIQVEKFRKFLKSSHTIVKDKINIFHFSVRSRRLAEALSVYNIVPRKSKIAKAPDSLLNNRHFWRGCIDGDGCVSLVKDVPRVRFLGTEVFTKQFVEFVRFVEEECRANCCLVRNNLYTVDVQGRYAPRVVLELYDNCSVYLNRKYKVAKEIIRRNYE